MKAFRKSNRGQALVIFVVALVGLIAMVGLAVDGGMIFSDRRHAQNAADTAAMAGALTRIEEMKADHHTSLECSEPVPPNTSTCWTQILFAAKDRASSNGYTGNLADSTVEVHIPPISGPYSDCSSFSFNCEDYIQVIISSNVDTFFAKVVGIWQTHNRVEAVALARYEPPHQLYGGNSLVQLKPTSSSCSGDFVLGGSGTVTLDGGGMFVNSNNPTCAFKETSSCVTLTMTNGAALQGVGGSFTSSCTNAPTMNHASDQYPFPPLDLLPQPAQCSASGFPPPVLKSDGYWHYQGGYYGANFFPPDRKAVLEAGIYCVENVVKTTNNNELYGSNVLIWIKNGGYFSLQGGSVRLSGITDNTSPYFGYLLYVDSDFSPWGDTNCSMNGGADDKFTGVIYAPNCNVSISGGSLPEGFNTQLIAYSLILNGDSNLLFKYDASQMPAVPEVRDTGLYR